MEKEHRKMSLEKAKDHARWQSKARKIREKAARQDRGLTRRALESGSEIEGSYENEVDFRRRARSPDEQERRRNDEER